MLPHFCHRQGVETWKNAPFALKKVSEKRKKCTLPQKKLMTVFTLWSQSLTFWTWFDWTVSLSLKYLGLNSKRSLGAIIYDVHNLKNPYRNNQKVQIFTSVISERPFIWYKFFKGKLKNFQKEREKELKFKQARFKIIWKSSQLTSLSSKALMN